MLRGKLGLVISILVIAVCVLITAARIMSSMHGGVSYDIPTDAPLIPSSAWSSVPPSSPVPTRTVTTWTTVTAAP